MRTVLATVSGGKKEAQDRVKELEAKYKGHRFEVADHDTRHQIVLTTAVQQMPADQMAKIRRTAQGLDPKHIKFDPKKPEHSDTGGVQGPVSGAPTGGNPTTATTGAGTTAGTGTGTR